MNRSILFAGILLAVVLTSLLAKTVSAAETQARPNVILCMADDLGWGDVGFNGNTVIKTPHLDAMAAAGLKFTRFYSGAPVCSPTRGSALTGRHPYRYGVFFANVGHMRPQELTLAEALKATGYATGHFGKWHLGTLTKSLQESNRGGPRGAAHFSPPWENGFDECFSTEAKTPTWDPMIRPKGVKSNRWWDPVADPAQAEPYGTNYWTNGRRITENLEGDDSRVIMDRAIPFIRSAVKGAKPFFAVIWFHAPHLPVVAGPKYTALYSKHDKHAQHYFGCITALDEQMGRLRRELRELEVAEDTMVWFCSDNGPEGRAGSSPGSAGPLRGRKRSLFEGGVRVPGLLEWPQRVKPGSVTNFPASTSDYFPTVMDALGLKPQGEVAPLDGISLLPVIEGTLKERPQPIGFESAGQVALIDGRYKLIRVSSDKNRRKNRKKKQNDESAVTDDFMLFDLVADPSESRDMAAEQPDRVRQMTATLKAWRESCRKSLSGDDYPGERGT